MRLIDADRFKNWIMDRYICFDHTLDDIDAQPTIDAISVEQAKWIPCSERLPDEQGRYLVSDGLEVWMCDFVDMSMYRGWVNEAAMPVVKEWMPLPKP